MVICPICNKKFKSITVSHLKTHKLTITEFKKLYPNNKLTSKETLQKRSIITSKQNIERGNINKNNYIYKKCKNCGIIIPYTKKRNQKFCSKSCSSTYKNKQKWKEIKNDITHPWNNRKYVFRSKGEKQLLIYLKETYPNYEWQSSKKIIVNNKIRRIDIYNKDLDIFIEYDGRHHFVPIFGKKRYNETIQKDLELNNFILNSNYRLIRINEKTFKNDILWKLIIDDIIKKDSSSKITTIFNIKEN